MAQDKSKTVLTHKLVVALDRGEGNDPYFQEIGAGFTNEKGTIIINRELWPTDPEALVMLRPVK